MVINNSTTSAKMAQTATGGNPRYFSRDLDKGGEGNEKEEERSVFFKF